MSAAAKIAIFLGAGLLVHFLAEVAVAVGASANDAAWFSGWFTAFACVWVFPSMASPRLKLGKQE